MGSTSQVGPEVNACLELLDMQIPEGSEGMHKGILRKYTSRHTPTVQAPLLAHQITGFVHMLIRTCGEFPLNEEQRKPENKPKYDKILERLNYKSPEVRGGFLEDAPGMGKTFTALAFFSWWSQHAHHEDDFNENKVSYKPTMLLTPDGHVLRQWVEQINKNFTGINLIVAKPGERWSWKTKEFGQQRFRYVDRSAFVKKEDWPSDLSYIWDTDDKRAARTIIITPYTTLRARLIQSVTHSAAASKMYSGPGQRKPETWCYNKKEKCWQSHDIPDFWKHRCAMTLCDEGHLTRNDKSQLHWVLRQLKARINWYLTATPMINGPNVSVSDGILFMLFANLLLQDIPALAKLLWFPIKSEFDQRAFYEPLREVIHDKINAKDKRDAWKPTSPMIWEHVAHTYDADSAMQLKRLDSDILRELLRQRKIGDIQKYYKYFEELATLRRSPSSTLPMIDKQGKDVGLSLKDTMPPKEIKTVIVKHICKNDIWDPEDETSEYLAFHNAFAKYVTPLKCSPALSGHR